VFHVFLVFHGARARITYKVPGPPAVLVHFLRLSILAVQIVALPHLSNSSRRGVVTQSGRGTNGAITDAGMLI